MPDPAIRVDNLSKSFKLGLTHASSLRDLFNRAALRFLGSRTEPGNNRSVPMPQQVGADGEFWALKNISFEIQQGEVVGIIGKNGAGKSTLLKILSRISKPTTGRAILQGRVSSLLEVGTGFHPELTGRENVYMNGTIHGMTKREIDRQFDAIVEFAELEKFIDTPVKRYSSGMSVRLGFAVAAHLEPEILIVDEVLAVGDLDFQRRCLARLHSFGSSGRTILFVSHNLEAVRRLCTMGCVLHESQIDTYGPIDMAIERYLNLHFGETTDGKNALAAEISDGIELTSVSGSGIDGCLSCSTGGTLTVTMEWTVTRTINGASFELTILSPEKVQLLRDATHMAWRREVKLLPGRHKVKLVFHNVPLAAGNYSLLMSVVRPAQGYYFRLLSPMRMSVQPADQFKTGRPARQPHALIAAHIEWALDNA